MSDRLTNENFIVFAARHYDNPQCQSDEEFYEDLKRFRYIKKLLTRYEKTGDLQERLILNHLIVLNNIFSPKILTKMLFLKMEGQMQLVKPFLVLLDIMPDKIYEVGEQLMVDTNTIPMDDRVVQALRAI